MTELSPTPDALASASSGRAGDRPLLTVRPVTDEQRFLNSAAVWLALMA